MCKKYDLTGLKFGKRIVVQENGRNANKATVERSTTHGATNTRTFKIWSAIKARTKDKSNRRYGGRGITICQRWLSFENFLDDMGEAPEGMSIDRINNDAGYEPGNCRWANAKQQSNNTSRNIKVDFQGTTKTLKEWAEYFGFSYTTVYMRYRKGDRGDKLFRSVKNAH